MTGTPTDLAQSALKAVLEEDDDLDDLLAGMLPGELHDLAVACDALAYWARRYERIVRREKAREERVSTPGVGH